MTSEPRRPADQGSVVSDDTFQEIYPNSAVIVLTPRCDLVEENGRARKAEYVTVSPVVGLAEWAKARGWTSASGLRPHLDEVLRYREVRWHYLAPTEAFPLGAVVDFQLVASTPVEFLDGADELFALPPVYREHLAQRYAYYAGRVGIDEQVPTAKADYAAFQGELMKQIDHVNAVGQQSLPTGKTDV